MIIETYFINLLHDNWIIDCPYIEYLYSCFKSQSGCTYSSAPSYYSNSTGQGFYGFGGIQDGFNSFFHAANDNRLAAVVKPILHKS